MGNRASAKNAEAISNPLAAALQGLSKMKALADLGLLQGVLPPQERPHLPSLRKLGFSGRDAIVLERAAREAPNLLAAMASASSMWTANAATVSPSADTADHKVHFTPANLATHLHRAIEPETTARLLKAIFSDPNHFAHHEALPATPQMGDEGAANHTRLCTDYGDPGVEIFVYGDPVEGAAGPIKFPARQMLAASQAVARLHQLDPKHRVFVQQNPQAIDQGVFHNDVIAVGNRKLFFYHELAFVDPQPLLDAIRARFLHSTPELVQISNAEVSLEDAVTSYLFNSQLISAPDGRQWLIAAGECEENPRVWNAIQRVIAEPGNSIAGVRIFDLRESMRNGGGPACLRLRVVLTDAEIQAMGASTRIWMNDSLFGLLERWILKYYRDRLSLADLADPMLLDESRHALDALTQLLGLGSVYDFQR
jgi:succinylarginine dihydrolase